MLEEEKMAELGQKIDEEIINSFELNDDGSIKNNNEYIGTTEKGIVLCEIWKLKTITIVFEIIHIIIEIMLLAILLIKL